MSYYDDRASRDRARRRREQMKRDEELARSFGASLFGDPDEDAYDDDEPYGFDDPDEDEGGEYAALDDLLRML